MKVQVLPRAECFAAAQGWGREYGIDDITVPTLIISISCYDTPIPNVLAEVAKEKPDIIKYVEFCQFDDIDNSIPCQGLIPMRDVDAIKIVNAIEKYKDGIKQIVVHCDAGYSRSPGVAAAIELALNGKGADEKYFNTNNYRVNMHCYSTMLKEFERRGYFNDL